MAGSTTSRQCFSWRRECRPRQRPSGDSSRQHQPPAPPAIAAAYGRRSRDPLCHHLNDLTLQFDATALQFGFNRVKDDLGRHHCKASPEDGHKRARRLGIRSSKRSSHARCWLDPWCTRARDSHVSGRSRVRSGGAAMVSRQSLRRSSVAIDPGIAFVRRRIGRVGEDGAARTQQVGTG